VHRCEREIAAAMTRAVLVCGGTGAIGQAIVHTLVSAGDHVAFSGRDRGRGEALAAATGAIYVPHDDRRDGAPVVEEAARHLGVLHGLVLNAGTIVHARLDDTAPANWPTCCGSTSQFLSRKHRPRRR